MFEAVIDHLWQSTLIVILAWLVTLALRRHGAHLRYWIWFAASMKFLVPFALIAQLGSQIPWPESLSVSPQSEWPTLAVRVLQPATVLGGVDGEEEFGATNSIATSTGPAPAPSLASQVLPAAEPGAESGVATLDSAQTASSTAGTAPSEGGPSLVTIALGIWVLGTFLLIARWGSSWLTLRGLLLNATPISIDTVDLNAPPLRACSSIMEPGIFGIFKPVLLIPHELVKRLTREQLRAIVRHERIHADRRDNLTAALHMLVEAVFWFHPFVWWIGARMVDERERACDEAVLASGVDPDVYASGLIEVCDFYLESPLLCAAGVGGGSLEDRVMRIADNEPLPVLSRLGRASLVAAPAVLCFVPLAIGLLEVQSARAQQAADYGELLECVNPDVLASLVFRSAPSVVSVSAEVPDAMAGITPPAEFTWIGSQTRNLTGSGLVGLRSTTTATYKTELARDEALQGAGAPLIASGWEKLDSSRSRPGISSGAFASSMPAQPDLYCREDGGVSVNVSEVDGTTYVSYAFTEGQQPTACTANSPGSIGNMPGSQYMPTLDFPPDPATGRPARRGGSGSSGSESRIEIFHSSPIGELASALSQQLGEQGWSSDASWTGTTTAGSSWTKQASDGIRLQGTLNLTATGNTGYTVMFRLLTLQ